MNGFNNIKIGPKLIGSFLIVAAVIFAVSLVGYFNMKNIDAGIGTLYEDRAVPLGDLGEANTAAADLSTNLYKVVFVPDQRITSEKHITEDIATINQLITKSRATLQTQEEKDVLAKYDLAWTNYQKVIGDIQTWVKTGKEKEAQGLMADGGVEENAHEQIHQELENLLAIQVRLAAQINRESDATFIESTWIMVVATAIGLLLAIGLGVIISRSITEPLSELVVVVQAIARGDLNQFLKEDLRGRKDEIGIIGAAFEVMLANLNKTLHQTHAITAQVVQAVDQVRSVSQNLASNSQEQSSAVEEVASSVEETNSQVIASSENASVANQLSGHTATLASGGKEKMKEMTDSMNSIARSSQEIAKIIKVIDEIAFQTNLLALNAAVEAARAGQYGKGFAVVAQEVRNLAERSARAAKSTAELIEDSGRKVQEGVTITAETNQALGEMIQNVVKVRDLVGEIAAASDEQSKALAQINQAITQVSQGTQSNSAQSEELASTADELGGLADRLKEEVANFKLRQNAEWMGSGLPAAITPEMLQAALAAMQKRATPENAWYQPEKSNGRGLHTTEIAALDRDERGYGSF